MTQSVGSMSSIGSEPSAGSENAEQKVPIENLDHRALLDVKALKKHFPIQKGLLRRTIGHVKAVDGVDFSITEGETLGLVGESGCGKTTTGRCILRLVEPTAGIVNFRTSEGVKNLVRLPYREMKPIRREAQMIFQDPVSSLDSRMTIKDVVAEPLHIHHLGTQQERTQRVKEVLRRVSLDSAMLSRYPHEFSGGQRQRIGVARALVLSPRLIVCDEPVSALDVSVQAQVLNLLEDLQREMHLTFLFIAHDLSVIEHISDRVMVMYLGKIVEIASSEDLYRQPKHPYSEALLAAVPNPDPRSSKKRIPLPGTVPDPSNPPPGCNFHTRCRYAQEVCGRIQPELRERGEGSGHLAACHFDLPLLGFGQMREEPQGRPR